MSGICDTCKRNQDCRKPIYGIDSCRLYVSDKESNYKRLFGTPERAARTLIVVHDECESVPCSPICPFGDAPACPSNFESGDYDALLDWLRGDAE